MNNIFKKAIAGVLAAVMTVTSLSITAFADKTPVFDIKGYSDIEITYKGNNENEWNKSYKYEWKVESGSELVTLSDADEKTVTVTPKKNANTCGTVTLSCQKMSRNAFNLFGSYKPLGQTYKCIVNVDLSGFYFYKATSDGAPHDIDPRILTLNTNVPNASFKVKVKSNGIFGLGVRTDEYTATTNKNGTAVIYIDNNIYESILSYEVTADGYTPISKKVNLNIGANKTSKRTFEETLTKATAPYTVNYYYDGVKDNTKTVTGTANIGSTVTITDREANNTAQYKMSDNSAKSIEIVAGENVANVYYTTNEYTITFNYKDANGGDASQKVTGKYGEAVVAPTAPDYQTTEIKRAFNTWDKTVPATFAKDDVITATYKDPEARTYPYSIVYALVDVNGNAISEITAPDGKNDEAAYNTRINAPETAPKGYDLYETTTAHMTVTEGENVLTVKLVPLFTVTTKYVFDDADTTAADDVKPNVPYGTVYTATPWSEYNKDSQTREDNEYRYTETAPDKAPETITDNTEVTYTYNTIYYTVTTAYEIDGGESKQIGEKTNVKFDDIESAFADAPYGNENADYRLVSTSIPLYVDSSVLVTYHYVTIIYTDVYELIDANGEKITLLNKPYTNEEGKPTEPDVAKYILVDENKNNVEVESYIDYSFSGWTKNVSEYKTLYTGSINSQKYGKTEITWDFNNGVDEEKTEYYVYGAEITFPDDPTKPADDLNEYVFTNWTQDEGCEGKLEFANEDKTLTAQYDNKAIEYTVKYVNGEETLFTEAFAPANDEVEPKYTGVDPTKSDVINGNQKTTFTFSGWDRTTDGTTIIYTANFTSAVTTITAPEAPATNPVVANPVIVITEEDPALADKPVDESGDKILDIVDEDTALADNPGTGVGLGGIITGASLSLIVCAACVFGGKKKIKK